jgi:FMN-dependent NADH-azoreductase
MEEFLALEQIKEKEEELKQFMIYAGRPGLWSDWIKFQAKARKERQEKEKQRKENRKQLFEIILVAFGLIFALGLLSMIVYAGLKANNIL